MLKLFTLGKLGLRRVEGGHVTGLLVQRKRTALLVYVATGAGEARSRDTLLGLFWPGLTEPAARRALNQALYAIRAEAGGDAIESCGANGVMVRPEMLWCDAVVFENSLRRGSAADALALYSGDFAPGLFVSGCGDFDRWLETTRHSLRVRAAHAAATLSVAAAAAGQFEEAIHWARRQLALAPHDESAVRSIIKQLADLGDRAEAVDVYESFARQLQDELGLDPSPETRRLIGDIRSTQPAAAIVDERATPPPAISFTAPALPRRRRLRLPATVAALTVAAAFIVATLITARAGRSSRAHDATRSKAEYLYDLGRTFSTKRTARDLATSIDLFRRATEEDDRYAAAYGGLAESYTLLAWYDTLSPAVAAERARDAAAAGLRLDARLAAAHASLGASNAWLGGNWAEASRQFRQAIDCDSMDATVHQWYGLALASAGLLDSGRAELAIAARRDPNSAAVATDFATVLFWSGRYAPAVAQVRRALALDPRFRPALTRLWRFYAATGDLADAFDALERTATAEGATSAQSRKMRQAFLQGGWESALAARASMLQEMPDARPERALQLATILSMLGRDDEALLWLRHVRDTHSVFLRFVLLDPAFSHLSNDGTFRELLRPIEFNVANRQGS